MNGTRGLKFIIAVSALSLTCISSLPAMAANKLIVKDSTGTTDKFVVTDTGRIGSGVSTPTAGLHIQGVDLVSTQLKSQYTGVNSGDSGGFFFIRKNTSGTNSMPMKWNRLGYLAFGSEDGATPRYSVGIYGFAAQDWISTSTPSYITFETTPNTSITRAERMRITSEGNVGIGILAPTQKLEINGGVRFNTTQTKPTCDSTTRGTLWFENGSIDKLYVCAQNGGTPFWRLVTLN